jgi:carbon-monoxide dehydrogenase large subunit
MPYRTPTGETLDSGDYDAALRRACERSAMPRNGRAAAHGATAGELVGIGVALYVEPCGQGWESARVTLIPTGKPRRQRLARRDRAETSYWAADRGEALGCAAEQVSVRGRHRPLPARHRGARQPQHRDRRQRGARRLARERPARQRCRRSAALIVASSRYEAPAEAWSYGCVIARMSIDRDTGRPQRRARGLGRRRRSHGLARCWSMGQLVGGAAQGLGQALLERIVYDDAASC